MLVLFEELDDIIRKISNWSLLIDDDNTGMKGVANTGSHELFLPPNDITCSILLNFCLKLLLTLGPSEPRCGSLVNGTSSFERAASALSLRSNAVAWRRNEDVQHLQTTCYSTGLTKRTRMSNYFTFCLVGGGLINEQSVPSIFHVCTNSVMEVWNKSVQNTTWCHCCTQRRFTLAEG